MEKKQTTPWIFEQIYKDRLIEVFKKIMDSKFELTDKKVGVVGLNAIKAIAKEEGIIL